MTLTGVTFRAVSNAGNGTIDNSTKMEFLQSDEHLEARYMGGSVATGHVIGKKKSESEATLLYHAVTVEGEIQAGKASAVFKMGADQKLRMYLNWQWLTGDQSSGTSEWEAI